MSLPFRIQTIIEPSEFRLKEKGSLFIATPFPILTENEAVEKLNALKKSYYDATHHCYAYILADKAMKYSDDGEPTGTAGIRILNALNHFDLKNVIAIVTRYYGGTRLGVGPLGKAYYDSAFGSIQSAKKIEKILYVNALITYKFDLSNLVHRLISKYFIKIVETLFNESPQIRASIPLETKDNFLNEVNNASLNKIKVQLTDLTFYQ